MKVQRSLLWPCVLALALVHRSLALHDPRQILPSPSTQAQTTAAATTTTTPSPTASETSTIPTSTAPLSTSTTPTSTPPPATSTPQTSNTPPPPAQSSSSPPTSAVSNSIPATTNVSTITSDGVAVTLTITSSATSSSASASAAASATSQSDEGDGGGLSTGSIVGMSVAAGVAVIGIVAFFVWKLTRKKFNSFDDTEAIKWPELNSHTGNTDTHALPTRETGRSGFDTGSEADLSRVNSSSIYSAPDLNASVDPYAVPALPHLNPNQPYRDDPGAVPSGYYDPYRGPVPGTIENGASDWQPEAYPMTQLGGPQAGRASPAPDYMYDGARTQSPALQAPYGGRSTPGLQPGYGGRASPGPQVAYSGGAVSPAPHVGYDPYGAR